MKVETMWVVGALLLTVMPASGRAAEQGTPGTTIAGVTPGVVDGPTARKLIAGGVKVVDVRSPAEFAAGHIPGAINVPYDQVAARHQDLGPSSTPVLLYCRSGRRTAIAASALRDRGFTTIYDLQAYGRWMESEPSPR